jgi:hypothetical protein
MFEISKNTSQRYLKLLVYGAPGVGKTTFAGSAQNVDDMRDVLFVDAESGSMSLAGQKDIDFVHVNSYQQVAKVYEFLKLHCGLRKKKDYDKLARLHEQFGLSVDKEYNTVVIDSLTEVQKLVMYLIKGMEIGNVKLDAMPDYTQIQEWGMGLEMLRTLIRSFRDLPMNVIFVAAEQFSEIQTGQIVRMPYFTGKLQFEVQGFLDVVGYMASRTEITEEGNAIEYRRLYLISGKTWQAKNRFASEGLSYIDDPTMQKLYENSPMYHMKRIDVNV